MLCGTVGKDAEFFGEGESARLAFSLALKRGKDGVDWVPVVLWGATAARWRDWGIRKGDLVYVEGSLRVEKKEGREMPFFSLSATHVQRVSQKAPTKEKEEEDIETFFRSF